MNEMNNQGNEFNQNVNYDNQNLSENMNYQNSNQVSQNNKEGKPKNNNGLVIILLLLVIGLAGFIVYDKVIKKDEALKPNQINNGSNNQTGNAKVQEFMLTKLSDGSELRLPKIVGNTETIKNLNDTIQKDIIKRYLINVEEIMKFIDEYAENRDGNYKTIQDLGEAVHAEVSCFNETSVKYKAYQKNNVFAIYVSELTCPRASGSLDNTSDYYFYDITNDKELDYAEAAEKFNAKILNEVEDENGKEIQPCKTFKDLKPKNYEISIDIDDNNEMTVTCANHY